MHTLLIGSKLFLKEGKLEDNTFILDE